MNPWLEWVCPVCLVSWRAGDRCWVCGGEGELRPVNELIHVSVRDSDEPPDTDYFSDYFNSL